MISASPSGHVIRHTKRKAWDLNPHPREGARFSKPARPTIADPRSWFSECPAGVEPGTAAERLSRQLGRLAPLPLGQGHVEAEGEGVEPPRLIARPLSGRLPSPVGLTFRITRLRWQESNLGHRREAVVYDA